MKNTNWYRNCKLIFFSGVFIFFVAAYLYFELQGEMFGSARFLFAIMIFASLYGIVKYKKNTEGIVSRNTLENWIAGAHSGVLHNR